MLLLVLGLVLFLGVHSTRIFADGWRTSMIQRLGEKPWKGLYAIASIIGFALIVWGYGLARQNPVVLWPQPPVATRHIAALLRCWPSCFFLRAVRAAHHFGQLRHPQVVGVKVCLRPPGRQQHAGGPAAVRGFLCGRAGLRAARNSSGRWHHASWAADGTAITR